MMNIHGLTAAKNSIILEGELWRTDSDKSLLFLDNTGNIRKKIHLGKIKENTVAIASSGKAAVVRKPDAKGNMLVTYYNEVGDKVWAREVFLLDIAKLAISDNGEMICLIDGNPQWSLEEWSTGELNVSRIVFVDSKGRITHEYKNFRNIGGGKFSGNGRYYAGLFWWQKDFHAWGKLIYMDVQEGKILWEKPFGGDYWKWTEQFNDKRHLAVSENGDFVAAVDFTPAEKAVKAIDESELFEVMVFDKQGHSRGRANGTGVEWIADLGLYDYMKKRGETRYIAAIDASKNLKQFEDYGSNIVSVNKHSLLVSARHRTESGINCLLQSILDETVWTVNLESSYLIWFSSNGRCLKGLGGKKNEPKIIFFCQEQ